MGPTGHPHSKGPTGRAHGKGPVGHPHGMGAWGQAHGMGLVVGPMAWELHTAHGKGCCMRPMARGCCVMPMAWELEQRAPGRCGMELPMAAWFQKAHGKERSAPLATSRGATKNQTEIQNFSKNRGKIPNPFTLTPPPSTYGKSPKPPIRAHEHSYPPPSLPYSTYIVLCMYYMYRWCVWAEPWANETGWSGEEGRVKSPQTRLATGLTADSTFSPYSTSLQR
jgi:hypothetical protein